MRTLIATCVLGLLSCGGDSKASLFGQIECRAESGIYNPTDIVECRAWGDRVAECCAKAPTRGRSVQECEQGPQSELGSTCQTRTKAQVSVYCEERATAYRCDFDPPPDAGAAGAGGAGDEAQAVCQRACDKVDMCFMQPYATMECRNNCGTVTSTSDCPNHGQIIDKYNECLGRQCSEFTACMQTVPSCTSTGRFGSPCMSDSDCPGGVCKAFDQRGMLCTVACTTAATCPGGSMGQKCNMRGDCVP